MYILVRKGSLFINSFNFSLLPKNIKEYLMKDKQKNSKKYLQIGELAKKTKVTTRTIKHYEDKGIMLPNKKTYGGFRLFEENNIKSLERIKNLQKAGFSLKEIKEIEEIIKVIDNIRSNNEIDLKKIEDMERLIQNRLDNINEKLEQIMNAKKILKNTMKVLREFKNNTS